MIDIRKETKFHWNILIYSIMGSMIICLSYLYLYSFINADRYYVNYGASGPFSVVSVFNSDLGASNLQIDGKTNVFHPNDWLGYTTNISIEKDVAVNVIIRLVNSNNDILKIDEYQVSVSSIRTGPKDLFFKLPPNLPSGKYKIKRQAIFNPHHGIPVSEDFTPFDIEVK